MTITLRPLLPQDVPHFLTLNIAAFRASSLLLRAVAPNGWSSVRKQARIEEWTKEIVRRPGVHFVVAQEEDLEGEIVGGARWEREGESGASFGDSVVGVGVEEGAEKETEVEKVKEMEIPDDADYPFNKEVVKAFVGMIGGLHERTMQGESCWHLHLLFSNLAHSRRGAGTALLRWGIERADAENLPCYLDATEMGKPLYERLGFEVREVAELDLARFGMEGVVSIYSMMRPARAKAGSDVVVAEEEKKLEVVRA